MRAFKSVGATPLFITKASGSTIEDADGNRYVDYVMSWGPLIHGHAPPGLVKAVAAAARHGTSFGAPSPLEVALAERVRTLMPSLERVRFVSSGTEATMSAVRVARAATGRDRLLKFEGCYHGHADAFLVKAGSGALTLGTPTSPGVTRAASADTLVAAYNDLDSVRRVFDANRGLVAAVIVEPIAGNMGVVPPADGFLRALADACRAEGALLIFDEVISGFRAAAGGAQAIAGVRPDLTCLGKIIGGGLPVGAYGGRVELMELVSPAGPVYQAGTLSGNPLAMTAVRIARRARRATRRRARGRRARSRCRAAGQRVRLCAHAVLHGSAGARLPVGNSGQHGSVRQILPRDADSRSVSATVTIRGLVPFRGAYGAGCGENDPRGSRGDEGRREGRVGRMGQLGRVGQVGRVGRVGQVGQVGRVRQGRCAVG